MTLTLDNIHQQLQSFDDDNKYQGVTYDLTLKNKLDNQNGWKFIPWGDWKNFNQKLPTPSVFEQAVLDVINDVSNADDEVCIDLSHLGLVSIDNPVKPNQNFFDDNYKEKPIVRIVDKIFDIITYNPNRQVTIRYLCGDKTGNYTPENDGLITALFEKASNYKYRNNLQNCKIYYGYFSPDIGATNSLSALFDNCHLSIILDKFVNHIKNRHANFLNDSVNHLARINMDEVQNLDTLSLTKQIKNNLDIIEQRFVVLATQFLKIYVEAYTWNHSKITAVNGEKLVTGGANYWPEYMTGQKACFDMAIELQGDATLSAHKFLNNLWNYVSNPSPLDNTSICSMTTLDKSIADFKKAKKTPVFPLSGNKTKNVFTDELKTKALTVGRSGIWPLECPLVSIQIFDALRDFILSIILGIVKSIIQKHQKPNLDDILTCYLAKTLLAYYVDSLSDDNTDIRDLLTSIGVSPAAWATRYARNYAIANAQSCVRLSQQKIVMDDLIIASKQFHDLKDEINSLFDTNWSGYFWPLDTIASLSKAIANFSKNDLNETSMTRMVQIVCSYYDDTGKEGYQDPVKKDEFISSIKYMCAGLLILGKISPGNISPEQIENIVDKYVNYQRISSIISNDQLKNHSKLVIVDDALSYIGSDNAYPSYNAEFGIWIEDTTFINGLVTNYYDDLWTQTCPKQP